MDVIFTFKNRTIIEKKIESIFLQKTEKAGIKLKILFITIKMFNFQNFFEFDE